jgi:hypothetical protein
MTTNNRNCTLNEIHNPMEDLSNILHHRMEDLSNNQRTHTQRDTKNIQNRLSIALEA